MRWLEGGPLKAVTFDTELARAGDTNIWSGTEECMVSMEWKSLCSWRSGTRKKSMKGRARLHRVMVDVYAGGVGQTWRLEGVAI